MSEDYITSSDDSISSEGIDTQEQQFGLLSYELEPIVYNVDDSMSALSPGDDCGSSDS